MLWHTRRKQIWSSSETNEPIYVVGSNTGWTVIRVKHEDYQQHKWARSFRWKTKSAFCACAITFRFYSTVEPLLSGLRLTLPPPKKKGKRENKSEFGFCWEK